MASLRLSALQKILKTVNNNYIQMRSKSKILLSAVNGWSHVQKVVTTSDSSTFVAWHPSQDFPYEYSLPLPPPAIPTSTLLKDEALQTAMKAFGNQKPEIARLELMRITHTSKHTWKPRQRDRKAKKTPMDREYL